MSSKSTPARLAADIGGTFTDVVLEHGGTRHSCKVLTTPQQPELAVLDGVRRLLAQSGLHAGDVQLFIHGTTLATNALIERKGARTALLTTEGFRDVLEMGFEKRFEQFDVDIERPAELVARPLRFTVAERVAADGRVLLALDEDGVVRAARAMAAQEVQAVAVGFLHAYANAAHEQRTRYILAAHLPAAVTICLSSEVCPEIREYERLSTTCANAYVRPLMGGYLIRLEQLLADEGLRCPLLLMMSGGGLTTLDYAARFPIRLVESGPAGGAILAAQLARECGLADVMAFDMGGTTAKICLIGDGEPERSRRFEIGRVYRNLKGSGLPVRIPVIELVEIGAGGGSIGRVDALSRITVGPDSSGSEPGPACYGRGGADATVTDANLQLGRIDARHFAGGSIALDPQRAAAALIDGVGRALDMDAFWSAVGICEIVEENMANAARVHAIERGKVIGEHTMIAFGGGAPLHAGRLAQKLGVRRVIVPQGAGVGSAIGFLRAPVAFEVVRSDRTTLSACDPALANARLAQMRAAAREVVEPAANGAALSERVQLELRYVGQGHELRVTTRGAIDRDELTRIRERFEAEYQRIYGLRIARSEVEIVTWSLTLTSDAHDGQPGQHTAPATAQASASASAQASEQATAGAHPGPREQADVWEPTLGRAAPFGRYRRNDLAIGTSVAGPALIAEDETTTVVPAGWTASAIAGGHLLLQASDPTLREI